MCSTVAISLIGGNLKVNVVFLLVRKIGLISRETGWSPWRQAGVYLSIRPCATCSCTAEPLIQDTPEMRTPQ